MWFRGPEATSLSPVPGGAVRVERALDELEAFQVMVNPGDTAAPPFFGLLGLVLGPAATRVAGLVAATVTVYQEAVGGARLATVGASGEAGRRIDAIQYSTGDGPCVRAAATGEELLVEFPATGWEELSRRAVGEGVTCAWSLPVVKNPKGAASLNLYLSTGGDTVWAADNWAAAHALAHDTAKVMSAWTALNDLRTANNNLKVALESRTTIGQAEGILMARQGIGADQAFDILRRTSQRTNRKVRDVAGEIVAAYNRPEGATTSYAAPAGSPATRKPVPAGPGSPAAGGRAPQYVSH
jgi:hypothetical protein